MKTALRGVILSQQSPSEQRSRKKAFKGVALLRFLAPIPGHMMLPIRIKIQVRFFMLHIDIYKDYSCNRNKFQARFFLYFV